MGLVGPSIINHAVSTAGGMIVYHVGGEIGVY
jgi:hypothetical protein